MGCMSAFMPVVVDKRSHQWWGAPRDHAIPEVAAQISSNHPEVLQH